MQIQPLRPQPEFLHQNVVNNPKLILSVDDDPQLLCTRQAILEQAGYEVLSAKDGIEALGLFRALAFDLVLLDYVMPKLYGSVVACEMKARKPHIPIIMVSAYELLPKLIPADMFISKGDSPAFLLQQIRQLLSPVSPLERCA